MESPKEDRLALRGELPIGIEYDRRFGWRSAGSKQITPFVI